MCSKVLVSLYLALIAAAVSPPVIDISSLFEQGHADRSDCVSKIDDALRQYGVFTAVGHSIDLHQYNEAIGAGKNLFKLPLEDKMAVSAEAVGGIGRGYLPFGKESGVSSFFEPKEGYSYGYDYNSSLTAHHPLQRPNVWPTGLEEGDKNKLHRVFHQKSEVAFALVQAIQEAINIASDSNACNYSSIAVGGDTISILRLFHYFPVSEHPAPTDLTPIGSSPHTDWGFLTLIVHDGTEGLQFLHAGEWNPVENVPGGIVINGGDFLHLVSGGRYHSPVHRVLCPPGSLHRLSFVLFFYPAYNATIPLPPPAASVAAAASATTTTAATTTVISADNVDKVETVSSQDGIQYNTLLDSQQAKESSDVLNFGDYIMEKWRGVYR